MYNDLVKRLREYAKEHCPLDRGSGICGCIDAREAADAIEELSRQLAEYKKFDGFLIAHGMFGESVYVPNEPPKEEV